MIDDYVTGKCFSCGAKGGENCGLVYCSDKCFMSGCVSMGELIWGVSYLRRRFISSTNTLPEYIYLGEETYYGLLKEVSRYWSKPDIGSSGVMFEGVKLRIDPTLSSHGILFSGRLPMDGREEI